MSMLILVVFTYILSIIIWLFIVYYYNKSCIRTFVDLFDKMYSQMFIPIVNTFLLFLFTIAIVFHVLSIKAIWYKIRNIKIKKH